MTAQEKDRIQNAIRHIQTAVDVDPWAAEIAVGAMKTQLSAEGTTSDLISRHAAIDAVKKNTFRLTFAEEQNCEGHVAWSANAVYSDVIEGELRQLPPAQPQIIRCKDCKYACIDPERESDEIYCSENDFWKDDDFYCGYAERRTDGSDFKTGGD